MSKINELIQTLCPDGVEYKKLGVTCNMKAGKAVAASDISSEYSTATPYPCYGGNGIRGFVSMCSHSGEFPIIGRQGALCGNINYATGDFYATEHAVVVESRGEYNQKFLKYLLIAMDLNQYKSKGAQPGLAVGNIEKIVAPVPPRPVQEEIVRILDEYTDLEAELEAKLSEEIELKQKQYMFLTSELIDKLESDSVVPLESVCGVYDGTHSTPQYTDSGVRFVSVENINDLYGSKKFISEEAYEKFKIKPQIGDVFMTRIGTMGKCAIVDRDEPLGYYVSLALLIPDSTVLSSEYLRWYLESGAGWKELEARTLWNATPIKINKGEIGKMLIKVPSLAVQDVVVKKIKAYYDAKTSLLTLLNTELESRKKQYAYYRDQLLTFKRKEV